MKKYKWLIAFSLILSIISIVISFLRIDIYITNDTYISLVLTLVGICTTIMVGYQIYNSINVKTTMEQYRDELRAEYDSKVDVIMTSYAQLDAKAIADRVLLYQTTARGYSDKDLLPKWETFGLTMKEALFLYSKYNDKSKVQLDQSLMSYVEISYNDFYASSKTLNYATMDMPKGHQYLENIDVESALKNISANEWFERDCIQIISTIKSPLGLDFDSLFEKNKESFHNILEKAIKDKSKNSND